MLKVCFLKKAKTMAKQDKSNKDVSANTEDTLLVQDEIKTPIENENETPEIHSNSESDTIENADNPKEEGGETTELDSEGEAETIGKEGDQISNPIETETEPKSKTEQREKIAKSVFDQHSTAQKLYFTSDLIPFFTENDALKHSRSLDNNTIVTVNRD